MSSCRPFILGIQPVNTAVAAPVSDAVRDAIDQIVAALRSIAKAQA
jgi:hypothetical protein